MQDDFEWRTHLMARRLGIEHHRESQYALKALVNSPIIEAAMDDGITAFINRWRWHGAGYHFYAAERVVKAAANSKKNFGKMTEGQRPRLECLADCVLFLTERLHVAYAETLSRRDMHRNWFPKKRTHLLAFANALMITYYIPEMNLGRRESTKLWGSSIAYLSRFRCLNCGYDFDRPRDRKQACDRCAALEDGEILEFPWGPENDLAHIGEYY
ncbi:hypothetical protein F4779DRAFT_613274 [Xylariaceae sp. FL0662B]|nr:hypothetical protein F4779DRAFT_613274 [Xylariaceae sp. FL0662B]